MLSSIVLATVVPALCGAIVISIIPPFILSRMGKALSLIATGLLLTMALTHLLPEAIELGEDIHSIGLTIWLTIMVLIAVEMFFNSGHHAETCPVCTTTHHSSSCPVCTATNGKKPAYSAGSAQSGTPAADAASAAAAAPGAGTAAPGPAAADAAPDGAAGSLVLNIRRPVSAADQGQSLSSRSAAFDDYHRSSCTDPECGCHGHSHSHDHGDSHEHCLHDHGHEHSHGHDHDCSGHSTDNRSTLHHLGHSHLFSLRTSDIQNARERARRNSEMGRGSIKTGLRNGGAPVLAGSLFHSLCDGIIIASSFMVDFHVGLAITAAIIAHEMPQQVSNYVLMLNFGMSRLQGYIVNLTAMLGSLTGGIIFFLILDSAQNILPFALAVAGGSFIYVALSDILPRLNKTENKKGMLISFACLLLGAFIAMMLSHQGHDHGPAGSGAQGSHYHDHDHSHGLEDDHDHVHFHGTQPGHDHEHAHEPPHDHGPDHRHGPEHEHVHD